MPLPDHRKIPPSNLDAEQSCLASMLLSTRAIEKALEIVSASDFYRHPHQILFETMESMYRREQPVDLTTLVEELTSSNQLEEVGSLPYIATLMDHVPTASNVEAYAGIVLEKSRLRSYLTACYELEAACYSGEKSADEVQKMVEEMLLAVKSKDRRKHNWLALDAGLSDLTDHLTAVQAQEHGYSGIVTGFDDLDRYLTGLQASTMTVIAARPGVGKTSLGLQIGMQAVMAGKSVGFFSMEMNRLQLLSRLVGQNVLMDTREMRTPGSMTDEHWSRVDRWMRDHQHLLFYIDDECHLKPSQIHSRCHYLTVKHGLDLVVTDYMQIMGEERRVDNRSQEVGEMARSMKHLSRRFNVPVIALCQLNREVERRADKRPSLADLRESGEIEQEADVVILLHCLDQIKSVQDAQQADLKVPLRVEAIIAKNRHGPQNVSAFLQFVPLYSRFYEMEHIHA